MKFLFIILFATAVTFSQVKVSPVENGYGWYLTDKAPPVPFMFTITNLQTNHSFSGEVTEQESVVYCYTPNYFTDKKGKYLFEIEKQHKIIFRKEIEVR